MSKLRKVLNTKLPAPLGCLPGLFGTFIVLAILVEFNALVLQPAFEGKRKPAASVALVEKTHVGRHEVQEVLRALLWRRGETWDGLDEQAKSERRAEALRKIIDDRLVALFTSQKSDNPNLPAKEREDEFLQFLKAIDAAVPGEQDIHLIMDNYGTHKTQAVRAWLAAHPRYHVHFTPTSASWLNLVERFFSQISEQWIKRSAHTSVAQLEQSIREYIDRHNEDPKPFVWHKSADTILASVARAAGTII